MKVMQAIDWWVNSKYGGAFLMFFAGSNVSIGIYKPSQWHLIGGCLMVCCQLLVWICQAADERERLEGKSKS